MKRHTIALTSIVIFALLAAIFTLYPKLDLEVERYFYEDKLGFKYNNRAIVRFFYDATSILTKFFIFSVFSCLLYLLVKHKKLKRLLCSSVFFLLISASIGPGLIVNTLLKDNFGRARPSQVEQFGGEKSFTKAFTFSNQCYKNCSFSSGHAAMGFYFSAIAYTLNIIYFARIYLAGISFGLAVGASRIIMGGHFASDVFTSAFIVLLVNHLIFLLWEKYFNRHAKTKAAKN